MFEKQLTCKVEVFQLDGRGEMYEDRIYETSWDLWDYPPTILPRNTWIKWSCGAKASSYSGNKSNYSMTCESPYLSMGRGFCNSKFPHQQKFATASFLSNRMPSPVLRNKSPFQKVYKEPQHSFLKVFGCQCFPYLQSKTSNRFQLRTYPWVFVGYSSQYKG